MMKYKRLSLPDVILIEPEVFDMAVDLRKSSPFFGKWSGEVLSAENILMLWVPPVLSKKDENGERLKDAEVFA